MNIGISVRIDVTKIEKARLYKGEKGTYLDLTTFIDLDKQDEYGNNGFIAQSVSKEEREQNVRGAILGNTKVFYNDSKQAQSQHVPASPVAGETYGQPQGGADYLDDESDIPF